MKLIVVESPYRAKSLDELVQNVSLARASCRYVVEQGHAPYASHLLLTNFLDDTIPEERKAGINCGLAWASKAEEAWFCLPEGYDMRDSAGLMNAFYFHGAQHRPMILHRWRWRGDKTVWERTGSSTMTKVPD